MPTINDLRQQAATIKNATQVGENTATRVGTTFETIADLLEGANVGQGIPSVDLAQLNSLRTPADQTTTNPTVYNVTTLHNLSSTTIKVGTLFIFSDGGRAVVTQILLSNYQVDGGGNISSPNTSQITMYYRMFNIVQETWSAWTLYAGGGGGGTIDPYPVSGSDNAVASNGVFEGLQKAAPEVNINDLDDLGDFVDMRTGESSAYTLKYMHTQSSTWLRVGVVMCFANQAQNTLTQIVFSNCVVDGGGNLVPNSATNVMNIYYRFKQFSGNPPEGMTIGEWSAWSYLSGDSGYQPDNEDIDLNANDQLQFANKSYDASAFSGLGRVYLRKNIVTSGGVEKNVLTQAMINTANTIYHIQYDYDLNGQTITLPAGCVLEFDGGSIKDSADTGKIVLTNTFIKCDAPRIGILNCNIEGTYTNPTAYPEWLVGSAADDFALAIQSLIDKSKNGVEIKFTAENYKVTPVIALKSNTSFTSENGSRIYTDETALYTAVFRNATGNHCENLVFKGLKFEQTATNYTELDGSKVNRIIIGSYDTDNIRISGCTFIFNGTNCISVNGSNCINTYIQNNVFIFKRATNPASYDVSSVYVCDHFHVIENNRFNGYSNNTLDRVNGAIESHGVCGIVANNTINNAKVCINVVNNITATSTDASGRQIIGNICSDVNNFVVLWPQQTFPPMKNVFISNNIATGIKVSAVSSTYSSSVKGQIEDLYINDNIFEGLANTFDGNEFDSNVNDVFNIVALKFYTPNNLSACIERNVIKNWPCQILGTGYYSASAESGTTQSIIFNNNTLINCFNGTLSHFYNEYYYFSLFRIGKYTKAELTNNVIDIPTTTTMPPVFCSLDDGSDTFVKGNDFKSIMTKMLRAHSGSTYCIDFLEERTQSQIFVEGVTGVRYIVNDYQWLRNRTKRCTTAGRNVSVSMDNATINLSYGFTFYQCDNINSLEIDDIFGVTSFGTSTALSDEKIACICNGKIYTNRWRTLKNYFEEGISQYSPTLTFVNAEFKESSIGTAASGPSTFDKGMLYYSLGGNRPLFKNNSDAWVDVFNHVYANYQGLFANRPTAASFGHMYVTTDANENRLLIKASTGNNVWVDANGFNGAYKKKGTTSERPTPSNITQDKGFLYYDTDLGKYICWNGTAWVNMDGTAL